MKLSLSEISTVNASYRDDLIAYAAAGFDGIGIWESKLTGDDKADVAALRASGLAVANCRARSAGDPADPGRHSGAGRPRGANPGALRECEAPGGLRVRVGGLPHRARGRPRRGKGPAGRDRGRRTQELVVALEHVGW